VGLVPTLSSIQWLRGTLHRGKAGGSKADHSSHLASKLRAIPQLPQTPSWRAKRQLDSSTS